MANPNPPTAVVIPSSPGPTGCSTATPKLAFGRVSLQIPDALPGPRV